MFSEYFQSLENSIGFSISLASKVRFEFPPGKFSSDFELVTENGIDSYVGKIKGDSMCFSFDFGYYSSDFEQTSQEYLENGLLQMI